MKRNVNVPNLLSIIRMLAAVPMWFLLNDGHVRLAFTIYVLALITDYLDGWLAVKLNQITDLGKVLDPWADKVLHVSVLLLFLEQYPSLKAQIYAVIMLAVLLVGLALVKLYFRIERRLGANWFGKVKLCLEGSAIIALFLGSERWGSILLWFAIGFAVLSIAGHAYFKEGKNYDIRKREVDK